MQECWRRRYASFLHLQLNEVADLHPSFMEHEVLARRELVVGSHICGTDLALSTRNSACLFHHSPNVVQTLPEIPFVGARRFIGGKYSWTQGDLLTRRVEGLGFPSVLLANRSLRYSANPRVKPNIVLHFLGNGLCCGEVIRPIRVGEPLVRHWSLGAFEWEHTLLTREWSSKRGPEQAEILFRLLKPSDQYYLECALHDADDSRIGSTPWYRAATFNAQSRLHAVPSVNISQHLARNTRRFLARKEKSERVLMCSCDVNVSLVA